ncbi:MAG: transketolase [Planctomycetes bacterium]|nr:transketolase [Planctomycetota bacterium]
MTTDTQKLAQTIRGHALRMIAKAKASHVGSCLSMADLLAVLYGSVLRVDPANPSWPERDRLIVSKGHGAAILYAVLAERGFFPIADLMTYSQDGSPLTGHVSHHVPGVELSTGSLGHGLPVGCGLALAARSFSRSPLASAGPALAKGERLNGFQTYVLLSDGELDEGSNWEAILFAGHHKLDSLTAIVDYNKIQSFGSVKEVLDLEPLSDKWQSFGWQVHQIDGHDHAAIKSALAAAHAGKPKVVIAHTIKGKGVAFMEDQLAWHYKSPDAKQLADALAGLGCDGLT